MKKTLLLGSILLLAAVLRFYQLGAVPPSPDWDEAALGYNAYSLLKTGKDEYGLLWPLALRSFDDYKPPLYAYLAIPSIAVFGLNTWSVRLPSVVMGILAVLGTYVLLFELLGKNLSSEARNSKLESRLSKLVFRNSKLDTRNSTSIIPLLSALLLAISPWHLQFSRIAFEANIGVTINIWGMYFLLKSLTNGKLMPISALILGLGFYAYHSERVFLPLLILLVFTVFFKKFLSKWKYVLVSIFVGLIIVGPLLPVVFGKDGLTRLKGTSSLSDQTGLLYKSVLKLEDDLKNGNLMGLIWENRRFVYAKTIAEGYLSHFSIKWLFVSGDNDRHHAPDTGLLYFWELPFLLWGMTEVFKRSGVMRNLLFGWLLITPIAASVTSETPHAIRTLVFLPLPQIFTAFGLISAYVYVSLLLKRMAKRFRLLLYSILVFSFLVLLLNIGYYFHMYYSHMNIEYSQFWQYGYKQAVEYTEANKSKYKKIVVSTKLEQPHMFYLFYMKYDPVSYLQEGGTASGGFREVRNKFDVYEFRPINWSNELHDGSILYVGTPREIITDPIYRISFLNGFEAIRIAE